MYAIIFIIKTTGTTCIFAYVAITFRELILGSQFINAYIVKSVGSDVLSFRRNGSTYMAVMGVYI